MEEATLQQKLGAAVRKHRKSLGYSQDAFADAISMHRAYFSAIERGERNVTLATMSRLAQGLSIPISQLLFDSGL